MPMFDKYVEKPTMLAELLCHSLEYFLVFYSRSSPPFLLLLLLHLLNRTQNVNKIISNAANDDDISNTFLRILVTESGNAMFLFS